jgi:spore germination protein YaaH
MKTMDTPAIRIVVVAFGLALGCTTSEPRAGVSQEQEAKTAPFCNALVLASQPRSVGTLIPQELRANAHVVDIVSPMWFDATDQGTITAAKGCSGPYADYLNFCHTHAIRLMPIIRNFSPQTLLSNTAAVKTCAAETAALAAREGFDGIVMDIEQVRPEMQPALIDLTRKLYPRLQEQGRRLCIVVSARAWGKWDYRNLALHSDWLYVMFYDYTGPWNKTLVGPTSPIQWAGHTTDIRRDLQRILMTGTPPEKLLFGVPLYGNDFVLNPQGGALSIKTLYVDDLLHIKQAQQANRHWDDDKKCPVFEYQDSQHATHQVWYEDAESYSNKLQVALQNRLGGIAIWALRNDVSSVNSDFWATVHEQVGDKPHRGQ